MEETLVFPYQRLRLRLATHWPLLAVCGLAALALFWRLGQGTLRDFDEAIYAEVSKEMIQSGDWLTPHWGYKPHLHKPPLLYWLTAILFQLFGVNELWARATSALSGILLIAVVFLIAWRLFGQPAAILASIILLTSQQFLTLARDGVFDILMNLFIYLAVYAYVRLREGNQRWWYLVGIAFALAFMTKSAGALVAPATIFLALLFDRQLTATFQSRQFRQAVLLAVVLLVPWHIVVYLKHSELFVEQYIFFNVVTRATTNVAVQPRAYDFYITALRFYFFPWFYLSPFALALPKNVKGERPSRVLLILVVLVFTVFTAAQSKIPWYIFSLYPALAILVAHVVVQAIWQEHLLARAGLALVAAAVALFAAPPVLAFTLVPVVLLGTLHRVIGRKANLRLEMVVLLAFLLATAVVRLRPLYDRPAEPASLLARLAASPDPAGRELLLVYGRLYQPAALFYSGRPVERAPTPERLAELVPPGAVRGLIIAREEMEELTADYEMEAQASVDTFVYVLIQRRGRPTVE
ncbi:MAG: glycosyltransferase family 39 protein [Chloroflexi bacterium]|nr:glycosyltransferase family 39 protein [Chloroflexota bacterium]MCI0575428.1 glycosyltransferase family 39 protein [Chloroflexota bacterium]MCI0649890.1 glycosyltransferase family 39 protein [Chloroflexota bacterium]MCI0725660.1 glycosyltransferase family 39 protein [Chloroflexota bacterium]